MYILFFFFFTFNFHLQSIDQWMGFSNQMSSTTLLEQLESHTCAAHIPFCEQDILSNNLSSSSSQTELLRKRTESDENYQTPYVHLIEKKKGKINK